MTKLLFRFAILFVSVTVITACSSSSDDTPTTDTTDDTAGDSADDTSDDTSSEDPDSYFRVSNYTSTLTVGADNQSSTSRTFSYNSNGNLFRSDQSTNYHEVFYDDSQSITRINYSGNTSGLVNYWELEYDDNNRLIQETRRDNQGAIQWDYNYEYDDLDRIIVIEFDIYTEAGTIFSTTLTTLTYLEGSVDIAFGHSESSYVTGLETTNDFRVEYTDIPIELSFGSAIRDISHLFGQTVVPGVKLRGNFIDKVYNSVDGGPELLATSYDYSFDIDNRLLSFNKISYDELGEESSSNFFEFFYDTFEF